MTQSKFIVVSEDPVLVQKAKDFAASCGMECEVRNPHANNSGGFYPSLASGVSPLSHNGLFPEGSNVVPFPSQHSKVSKMNDLEAQAIEQAIHAYRGNLTEAAKALGIGRATLYRKVKLYNIDPSSARRKKAA
jgi:DNA-binding NtrC family response regulator